MRARTSSISVSLALGAVLFLKAGGCLQAQNENESSAYHEALSDYKSGNYAGARVAIDEAETAKPNDLATDVLKAHILVAQRDFADAEVLLRRHLSPASPIDVPLALGDLFLHKGDFTEAVKFYEQVLQAKPGDPDVVLKLVYANIGTSDLVVADKYASELKPFDPVNPAYYFARAALAQATGKSAEADQDVQTVRTLYGISVADRYLKLYIEMVSSHGKNETSVRAEPASAAGHP